MSTLYWIAEYSKVLLAYLFLTFVWPSVLFRGYLKGKGKTFWFAFCTASSVMIISTVVLMLGIMHLLNVWVMRILFYGSFLFCTRKTIASVLPSSYTLWKITNGTYGKKLVIYHIFGSIKSFFARIKNDILRQFQNNLLECILLAITVLYGMLYFTWGVFQDTYYGFGDMYTHSAWIYGLVNGKAFSHGVYPEGMHCLVYSYYALFNFRVFNVMLFLQCIHIAVFLISAHLMLREFFNWKYSGILMLILFLTLKLDCIDEIFSMSRLQWTLPQEYALQTVFLIPLFLVRYLKHGKCITFRGKTTKNHWDANLVVFMLLIAASITLHFYATIMAVCSCLGVVCIWWRKVFRPKNFLPLAASAILALLLAGTPMAIAFATGTPLEGSLTWAMNVAAEVVDTSGSSVRIKPVETAPTTPPTESTQPAIGSPSNAPAEAAQGSTVAPAPIVKENVPLTVKLSKLADTIYKVIQRNVSGTYYGGYHTLYREDFCNAFLVLTGIAVLLGLFGKRFAGYGFVAWISILIMIVYSAPYNDCPPVIASSRVCTVEHMFILSLVVIPVDILFSRILHRLPQAVMGGAAIGCCAALVAAVVITGNFHGFLYFEFSRYDTAAKLTDSIIADVPKGQFTIISTTDELYQAIDYGFHEELITFWRNQENDTYYIPTPYLFFFVEKQPLNYGHSHFFTGPKWLASEIYPSFYVENVSQCPAVSCGEISADKATEAIQLFNRPSITYSLLSSREVVESKTYYRCLELMEQYPNEMNIYYEDDSFICFCLKQNPFRLFNLAGTQQ